MLFRLRWGGTSFHIFIYKYTFYGSFAISILNEMFCFQCVLETPCNKLEKTNRCLLLKGMNTKIHETTWFAEAVSQATPLGFLPHLKCTTKARNWKWLKVSSEECACTFPLVLKREMVCTDLAKAYLWSLRVQNWCWGVLWYQISLLLSFYGDLSQKQMFGWFPQLVEGSLSGKVFQEEFFLQFCMQRDSSKRSIAKQSCCFSFSPPLFQLFWKSMKLACLFYTMVHSIVFVVNKLTSAHYKLLSSWWIIPVFALQLNRTIVLLFNLHCLWYYICLLNYFGRHPAASPLCALPD